MGDIIEFPTRTVRGWAEIERALRAIFAQASASKEMQDEVLSRMKEFFYRCSVRFGVSLQLPASLSTEQREAVALSVRRAFEDHEKRLQDFMNQILLERLQLEIDLYKLRHE